MDFDELTDDEPTTWLAIAARAALRGDLGATGIGLRRIALERMHDEDIGAIAVAIGTLAAMVSTGSDAHPRDFGAAILHVTEVANAPPSSAHH